MVKITKGIKRIIFILTIDFYCGNTSGGGGGENARITEDSIDRLTEDGQTRVIE